MQDRIQGLERIEASRLVAHPANWRKHPTKQKRALRTMLKTVGWADAIVARDMGDGTYQIIDGHLRAGLSKKAKVPVLVVDVNDEEAKMLLATHDAIGAMADVDGEQLKSLLTQLQTDDDELDKLIDDVANTFDIAIDEEGGEIDDDEATEDFGPTGPDDQSRLDQLKKCTCPECGHEFRP